VGCNRIDPHIGAVVESSRGIELAPPKTAESARIITLPPFLVALLRAQLATHDRRFVFVSPLGEMHRRSNFGRRTLTPAVNGTLDQAQPVVRLAPVKPGLTFHGLRHGHKTWMIKPVGAENRVTSCNLHVFVDEAAEPISPERPDGRAGTWGSAGCGRALIE
jgi:integrase